MTEILSVAIIITTITSLFLAIRFRNIRCEGPMPASLFTFIAILFTSGLDVGLIEADMDAYDFLSHVPVVEGAGGVISNWRGEPLGLETDGRTLAAATPELHEKVLELLAQT